MAVRTGEDVPRVPRLDIAAGADASVLGIVDQILAAAVERRASDIHLEPYEREFRVRFRIDGVLYPVFSPPLSLKDAIVSRLKIMARLDIAEKRLPQDGRMKIRGNEDDIDLRVCSLPTLFGEKLVLRLLDRATLTLDTSALGFEAGSLARFERAIARPWGMVLVTGPTGSGKTNTLYSAICRMNTTQRNVLTAEDPVEFNLAGINQLQVRESIGLTFASALRAFLRQDPNVILVGEIRDAETADIAVKAAMTGHLVLSTLHTNDAPGAVTRLIDMGVPAYLVAGALQLVCAQRLVRRICDRCRRPDPRAPWALVDAGFSIEAARTVVPAAGTGCADCHDTGYRGRVGLFEVMQVGEALRELIASGAPAQELRRQALRDGMSTLRDSGLRKVADGLTSLDDVLRETVR